MKFLKLQQLRFDLMIVAVLLTHMCIILLYVFVLYSWQVFVEPFSLMMMLICQVSNELVFHFVLLCPYV